MKKSLFSLILTAALLTVGAVSATAVEPKPAEVSPARLEEAKAFYIDSVIGGHVTGRRIAGKTPYPPAKMAALRKFYIRWTDEVVLPYVRRKGLLDDWVAIQCDPEVRKLAEKILGAKNIGEFLKFSEESTIFIEKRYPDYCAKYATPEWMELHQKRREAVKRLMSESVPAADDETPKINVTPERLAEAKTYYVNGFVEHFKSGWEIAKAPKLSDARTAAVKKVLEKWLNDEFIPYLIKGGILDEWVAMQLDKDWRKIDRKVLAAKTREEILTISREGDILIKKRYPKLAAKLGTPELNNLMIRLKYAILSAATENR